MKARCAQSITVQKYVGKLRKRRALAYTMLLLIVLGVMTVGASAPAPRTVIADAITPPEDRIVEEVFLTPSVQTPLHPSLFGGAFVAEAYAVGTDAAGSGGLEEDPVGILVHSSSLVNSLNPLTIEASSNERNDVTTYAVQSGDTLSTIAARFGITTNTLLWANGLVDGSIIRPGDELKILPVTGLLHTVKSGETISAIASRFNTDAQEIIAFNGLPADGTIRVGDTLIIPDGVQPRQTAPASQQRYTYALPTVSGYFIYPAPGRISQGLHGYNAVDIAQSGCYSYDVPVYAAAGGRVTTVDGYGWNGGYGQFVKVQHENGTATLYAHLRQILVGAGNAVSQGQILGLMGSTGRSTGCHVHFEVHGARNPFAF